MNKVKSEKKDDVQSMLDQYNKLYDSIDKANPNAEKLITLRSLIENSMNVINHVEVQINKTLSDLLILYSANRVDDIVISARLKGMKTQMQYSESPMIEKMLINNIMVSWLRLQIAETSLTKAMNNKAPDGIIETWDKLVSTAQKRYMRATESLVRVRKSSVKFQINIATDGGKQKNLQV